MDFVRVSYLGSKYSGQVKILFFSEGFGNITFIESQVKGLSGWHEVLYVCNSWLRKEGEEFVNVKEVPFEYSDWYNRLRLRLENHDIRLSLRNHSFAKQWKCIAEEFDPDIIHLQFGYEALRVLDNHFDKSRTYIIHFRGYDASKKLRLKTYVRKIRKYLSYPNVFPVFVSDFLKSNLERHGLNIREEHLILHSNTDLDFFKRKSEYPARKTPFIYLQVSSFREKKGHIPTLMAFKLFQDRYPHLRSELWFTGDESDEFKIVRSETARLGLNSIVKFLGKTSKKETKALLEKCHAFVLHSITAPDGDTEGIPNAIMEAMSMELPVISTLHAGIPELIENGKHGILIAENDLEAYVQAMLDIRSWGIMPSNREKVKVDFSKDQHFNLINDFYHRILSASF